MTFFKFQKTFSSSTISDFQRERIFVRRLWILLDKYVRHDGQSVT